MWKDIAAAMFIHRQHEEINKLKSEKRELLELLRQSLYETCLMTLAKSDIFTSDENIDKLIEESHPNSLIKKTSEIIQSFSN